MERWEFLIQKEGTRIWIPINQQTWELEEGRYRMVAHSSQPNFEVEIRITHQKLENECGLSQIKNSFRRTNGQGLIMILPFTYLDPGLWELRCYSDLMSELLGRGWRHKIKLQVSSKIKQEQIPLKELPGNTQIDENNLSGETTQILINQERENQPDKASYYLQKLEQLLRQKIEPMLPAYEASEITDSQTDEYPALQLILNQNTFNRTEGEPILISGTVEATEANLSLSSGFKGKLRYQLHEPEAEEAIFCIEELVEEKTVPFIFNYALEIPAEWEMAFLAAEVILETESAIELARQSLTITTELTFSASNPVNYTITLSDPEDKYSFAFDLLLDEEIITSPLNVDLPQPSKMARVNRYFQQSGNQILPPKITRSSNNLRTAKTPQLPQIPQPQLIEVKTNEVEDYKKESPKPAPVDQAFQSLELKERFLERLSSLAGK